MTRLLAGGGESRGGASFVTDHLEILHDIHVATVDWGRENGVPVERTRPFNADPAFIAALADVVGDAS
jgi:protoheme ferro-lyase